MRCSLTFTCPRRKMPGYCCAECGIKDTCIDACMNTPDTCLMSREPTTREIAYDLGIKCVKTIRDFQKIADTGQPLGMYYAASRKGSYCSLDNRTGSPVMSGHFTHVEDAILWLAARVEANKNGGTKHEG